MAHGDRDLSKQRPRSMEDAAVVVEEELAEEQLDAEHSKQRTLPGQKTIRTSMSLLMTTTSRSSQRHKPRRYLSAV